MANMQVRRTGEMQGSPTEERALNPLPRSELERRWAAVRAAMRDAGIDALVVGGTSASANGHLRWLTGIPYLGGNSRTAIFPIEGLMTMVIIVHNTVITLFMFGVMAIDGIRNHLHDPAAAWNSAFWTVLAVELAVFLVLSSLPFFVAARRRDFT